MAIVSDINKANQAVSKFKTTGTSSATTVNVSISNATSMQNGMKFANNIVPRTNSLNQRIYQDSKALPAYAEKLKLADAQGGKLFKTILPKF